jgi:hypothetical protein
MPKTSNWESYAFMLSWDLLTQYNQIDTNRQCQIAELLGGDHFVRDLAGECN